MNFEFGPELLDSKTRFRLWAPSAAGIELEVEGLDPVPMAMAADGWQTAQAECGAGARYRFRLACGQRVPDPASRAQPQGVHGPSLVTDPASYHWRCAGWRGRPWEETIFYELHAGLFGGFRGVAKALPALAELGITAVELMPVGEFPGRRNWGYDGVLPFAPKSAYGTPDELKALVDRAHELGLMMFLDVVYNHFGPDGNWLPLYVPEFFRAGETTPWGAAIDFSRPPVRRYFTENAFYWLDEFRFDGLRLDAVHAFSERGWIVEMVREIRSLLPGRQIHFVVENEANEASLLRAAVDAQWNDDFHNVVHVLLTGETHSYYADFADRPAQRLARALAQGFVYQGESSRHRHGRRRGTPSADLPPQALVNFLQNHDQTGNRAIGERLTVLVDAERLQAAVALLLLCPSIPLLFMDEEAGSARPFLFFTDFDDSLADAVRAGRRAEFAAFPDFLHPEARETIPDPNAEATFDASRPLALEHHDADWRDLYKRLIAIRRKEIVPRLEGARHADAVVLAERAVCARWRLGDGAILTIACNLGDSDLDGETPAAEPLWGLPGKGLPARTTCAWIEPL